MGPLEIPHAHKKLKPGNVCSLPTEDLLKAHTLAGFDEVLGVQDTGATEAPPWSVSSDDVQKLDSVQVATGKKTTFFTILKVRRAV